MRRNLQFNNGLWAIERRAGCLLCSNADGMLDLGTYWCSLYLVMCWMKPNLIAFSETDYGMMLLKL
jgi:hypothetical protein